MPYFKSAFYLLSIFNQLFAIYYFVYSSIWWFLIVKQKDYLPYFLPQPEKIWMIWVHLISFLILSCFLVVSSKKIPLKINYLMLLSTFMAIYQGISLDLFDFTVLMSGTLFAAGIFYLKRDRFVSYRITKEDNSVLDDDLS